MDLDRVVCLPGTAADLSTVDPGVEVPRKEVVDLHIDGGEEPPDEGIHLGGVAQLGVLGRVADVEHGLLAHQPAHPIPELVLAFLYLVVQAHRPARVHLLDQLQVLFDASPVAAFLALLVAVHV